MIRSKSEVLTAEFEAHSRTIARVGTARDVCGWVWAKWRDSKPFFSIHRWLHWYYIYKYHLWMGKKVVLESRHFAHI